MQMHTLKGKLRKHKEAEAAAAAAAAVGQMTSRAAVSDSRLEGSSARGRERKE